MRSSSARRDASDAMCKWTSSSDGAVGVSQFEVPNPAPTLVRSAADFDLSFFDDLFRLSGDWKKPFDFFFSLVVGELVSTCLPGVELSNSENIAADGVTDFGFGDFPTFLSEAAGDENGSC